LALVTLAAMIAVKLWDRCEIRFVPLVVPAEIEMKWIAVKLWGRYEIRLGVPAYPPSG